MTPLAPVAEIFGAYFNNVRGDNAPEGADVRPYRFMGRMINVVAFGLFLFASTYTYGAGLAALFGFASALGMWAGQAPGWGRYIGALAGTEKEPLEEVKWIDRMIAPLHPDNVPNSRLGPIGQMMAWGFAGCTLRGTWWGVCLSLPVTVLYLCGLTPWIEGDFSTGVAWMIITASAFGIVYGVVIHTYKHHPLFAANPIGKSWGASEPYFGALIWGAFAVAFLA